MVRWSLQISYRRAFVGYTMVEVCRKFKIPKSSLKDHIVKRSRGRDLGTKIYSSIRERKEVM